MDFNFTQQQDEMRTHLETFLNKICPEEYVEKCDKDGVPPYEAYKALCDAGWLGLIIPEEYGGSDFGLTGGSPANLIYLDGVPDHKISQEDLVATLEREIREKAAVKEQQLAEKTSQIIARG